MKKINYCVNPLNIQWACSPSLHLYARNERILPLWSCLSLRLLMMRRHSVLICKELMLRIWKKLTIASILWIYSEHAHLLCSFTTEMCDFFSLKLSASAIIDDAETVGTDLQRANVENMKKIAIASIPWIYSKHAHLLRSFMPDMCEFPLFEAVFLCDYWWCGDSQGWFAKI